MLAIFIIFSFYPKSIRTHDYAELSGLILQFMDFSRTTASLPLFASCMLVGPLKMFWNHCDIGWRAVRNFYFLMCLYIFIDI